MLARVMPESDRKRGKPETFRKEQNEALREELVEWADTNGYTSERIGELLGVGQQTASGYLNGTGNFSWPAACALAWHRGYQGVDEMLIEHGVFRDGAKITRTDREHAEHLAHKMKLSEVAIERVNAREKEAPHHVPSWWVDKYIQEHRAILEEREARRRERDLENVGPRPRGRPKKS